MVDKKASTHLRVETFFLVCLAGSIFMRPPRLICSYLNFKLTPVDDIILNSF